MSSKDLAASTLDSRDILASIEEEVTCPVCKQVPRNVPIPVCPNGHIICQPCLVQLETLQCPTCRTAIVPNKFSVVAAGVASKLPHACRFPGCRVKLSLDKVKFHELNCRLRPVECGCCHEMAPIQNFLDHNCHCFDWTLGGNVKTVMIRIGGARPSNPNKLYVSGWDGRKPIVFQSLSDFKYPPAVYMMDEQVFFLGVARRKEEKRWMFYAAIQGTEKDSATYQVNIVLEDRKKKNVNRSVCKVLPMDKMFNLNNVENCGNDYFVTVHDLALQRKGSKSVLIAAWDAVYGTNGSNETNRTNGTNGLNGTNGTYGSNVIKGSNRSKGTNGSNGSNEFHKTNGLNGTNGSNVLLAAWDAVYKRYPGYIFSFSWIYFYSQMTHVMA